MTIYNPVVLRLKEREHLVKIKLSRPSPGCHAFCVLADPHTEPIPTLAMGGVAAPHVPLRFFFRCEPMDDQAIGVVSYCIAGLNLPERTQWCRYWKQSEEKNKD